MLVLFWSGRNNLKLGRNDFELRRNDSELGRNDSELGRNDSELGRNDRNSPNPPPGLQACLEDLYAIPE